MIRRLQHIQITEWLEITYQFGNLTAKGEMFVLTTRKMTQAYGQKPLLDVKNA